ncbi:MAG: bifunctional hydroxymethylpyrimidine kinase/phosphomethylpyrimidine kinase [Pseudonocardia sp.]|nr:bifunctional hydroxymethylpyrimidine kinase/phosphomethylpyrimidine kinase [Pseudonocardia sp.]
MTTGPLVVLGDTLLDVDIDGVAHRTVPGTTHAPVIDVTGGRWRPGGAGLAALLAAADGVPVRLITMLCHDAEGDLLAHTLRHRVELVAGDASGASCVKIRIRDRGRTLARLDHGNSQAQPATHPMIDALADAGAVLVADYGRGITSDTTLTHALTTLATHIPVIWDPHPRGSIPIPGCALTTPNLTEAQLALNPRMLPGETTQRGREAARLLLNRWNCWAALVTLGEHGAAIATTNGHNHLLPVDPADNTADTCGAGDRLATTLAAEIRQGTEPLTAAHTAVQQATHFVKTGGANALRLTH